METVASVADPRLFDPRVGEDKTYITTMGMQQTSVHDRTTSYKTGWDTEPGFLPLLRQVYYLTTMEWKESLPWSPLSHLDYGSRNKDLPLGSGIYCGYYNFKGTPALHSFVYLDVGELNFSPLFMTGMIQDHHLHALQDFESLGTSMSGICYVIVKQYWAAWGLSESVVFHVVSWVSFRVVLVCFFVVLLFVVFVFVLIEDTLIFALTYSSISRNSQSKTKRFDDRLSLERARHEPKKKLWRLQSQSPVGLLLPIALKALESKSGSLLLLIALKALESKSGSFAATHRFEGFGVKVR